MNLRWPGVLIASALTAAFASAQNPPPADPAKAQGIVTQVCAACHGADGNSAQPANPNLAGQHADYTLKQLMNFKLQSGKPAERPNPIMGGMVANLSADDMRNVAGYFESQKPRPRAARDPQLVKLGQTIYRGGVAARGVAACTACHGPSGAGVPAQFPRLAGQYAEYIAAQLTAFREGKRTNDLNGVMRGVAAHMNDGQIRAVAEYAAGLR